MFISVIYIEYISIFFFFIICYLFSFFIFILSYFFSIKKTDQEKISAYECGFNPFDDARTNFDVRFYLVAILFLIFGITINLS